jgi:isoquinoline 1-oxidoreductase beta subunit
MSGQTSAQLTRRAFLKAATAGGAALIIGIRLPGLDEAQAAGEATAFTPGVFLRIEVDGAVTVIVPRSELGQGARTALPMIVAEELEADWRRVRVEPALAHLERYGSMTTGGSTSVREFYAPLRQAGAAAREMLCEAAARTWKVPAGECHAQGGAVIHAKSGRRLEYGALVPLAATLPVPTEPALKDPETFRIIGTSPARLDSPEKLRGAARFGLDTRVPGQLFVAIARSPVFGAKPRSWDAAAAKARPGVREVLQVDSGIAVAATSTWAALQARDALRVEWEGGETTLSSESIRAMFAAKLAEGSPDVKAYREEGDLDAALAGAARTLTAEYHLPFLAHASIEPLNCAADVRADSAEIWAPTQAPQWPLGQLARLLGLPPDRIRLHTTLAGGAFGRRLMPDFVVEAALASKAFGSPVQVVWDRADDMRGDWFRPASLHRLAAGLDGQGRLVAWRHRFAAPSIMGQLQPGRAQAEPDALDGAATLPYEIANLRVEYAMANTAVPVGWWRSVYNSQHPVANECFLDEIAVAAGVDPLALRLGLLPAGSRLRGVLERVAAVSGWAGGAASAAGRARGLACHECFGSAAATVAEVSVDRSRVTVHRVWTAIDCGLAVHPDGVRAQCEGNVAMAVTALLHGEITIEGGRVQQTNFDSYPLLTMGGMPEVQVEILESGEPIGGVGEPGQPPVVPAVLNAVFAATGTRVRELPVRLR